MKTKTLSIISVLAFALTTSASSLPAINAIAATSKVVVKDVASCAKPARGKVACLAIKRTRYLNGVRSKIRPLATVQPMGGVAYGANQLRKAYGVTELGARYKVIAIVDAYHSASAYQDLVDYRAMYDLGPIDNCTRQDLPGMQGSILEAVPAGKNPCFMQLDQNGKVTVNHDTEDEGWAQETSLDIEMATAICPHCSILLVEAKTASMANFDRAVAVAGNFKNMKAISNSYGGSDNAEFKYPSYAAASAKGIAVVASSGDSGYGASAPASFASVIAVGGTSLQLDSRGRWASETAWAKAGSGCSTLNRASAWQRVSQTGCAGKLTADVSAVADPSTGVAVTYDGGWYTFGGTSVAAPIIAGMYAIGPDVGDSAGAFTIAHASSLHDITEGSNGRCDVKYWCNAREGWDGPTGLGSPMGSDAF
ncbi:MAG: S8 family serine peptidase [Rhodoluna sp.]